MKIQKEIKRLFENVNIRVSNDFDARILKDMSLVYERNMPAKSPFRFYRIIPVSKFAIAAVLVIAIIIGLYKYSKPHEYKVFLEIVNSLKTAETVRCNVVANAGSCKDKITGVNWTFKKPGLFCTVIDSNFSINFNTFSDKGYCLLPKNKKYVSIKMINVQKYFTNHPLLIIEKIKDLPLKAEMLNQKREINGQIASGFNVVKDQLSAILWINIEEKKIISIELKSLNNEFSNIMLKDIHLNENNGLSLAAASPPQGFQSLPVRIEADLMNINEQRINEFCAIWTKYFTENKDFNSKMYSRDRLYSMRNEQGITFIY